MEIGEYGEGREKSRKGKGRMKTGEKGKSEGDEEQGIK